LKDLNRKESDSESRWKKFCEDQFKELWQKESMSGSEGHLLAHPDEVKVTLAGDHAAALTVVHTLSKGVCGDDPPTMFSLILEDSS
jgi:hypothetical protein